MVASYVVSSWVSASCCIPSVADFALVVASVDSIYCFLSVVPGVVLPLVVQHPLALAYGSFEVPTHHVFSCCVDIVHDRWVLFVACPTCVIVGIVSSVCQTVIIIVEIFYVLGQ